MRSPPRRQYILGLRWYELALILGSWIAANAVRRDIPTLALSTIWLAVMWGSALYVRNPHRTRR